MKIIKHITLGTLFAVLAMVAIISAGSPSKALAKNYATINNGDVVAVSTYSTSEVKIIREICDALPYGIAKKISRCQIIVAPDTSAPVISNIDVDSRRVTSALIRWETNERTMSTLYSSTTSGFKIGGSGVESIDEVHYPSGGHRIPLVGLTPNTVYYFIIQAKDAAGNVATSAEQAFRTLPASSSDTTAPAISNVEVRDIGNTMATIKWSTNEGATSIVWYSTTTPLNRDTASKMTWYGYPGSHEVDLVGLTQSTKYYYVVGGADMAGNYSYSNENSFTTTPTTGDTTAPVISDIVVTTNNTEKNAVINWKTNENADSKISYNKNSNLDGTLSVVSNGSMTMDHSITLPNLDYDVAYYYKIESKDSAGNAGGTSIGNFTLSL